MTDAGPPERDPLVDLVSRSIGARVEAVEVEVLDARPDLERQRLRFRTDTGAATAIFERSAKGRIVEAQLIPFLARKTDRVPAVRSRGLPPPHAALGPWLLLEDVLAGPTACDGDVAEVLRAKLAIEHAVGADAPALRALGLREAAAGTGPLATAPRGLVHGMLTCAAAHRVERGVVIVDWSHAFLGPTVLDAVSLAADLTGRGDAAGATRVKDTYVRESGDPDAEEHWSAAHLRLP